MSRANRVTIVVAIVAGLAVFWLGVAVLRAGGDVGDVPAAQAAGAAPGPARIGTYDGRAIAVAFVPSTINSVQLAELVKKAKDAEAAGDTARVAELRAKGAALQTLRHLQGFSNAPVDDILDHVRERLPEVARKAGVCAIVRETDFHDATVETIDVTDQIVALFNPNERTLKTVKDIRKHKPMSIDTVLIAEREEHKPRK
jgi:hypothetical protein